MSKIKVDNFETTTGVPLYPTRAWCNYSGPISTVIASGNVSSLTDNAVGVHTINFANSMPDAGYAWSYGGKRNDTVTNVLCVFQKNTDTKASTSLRVNAVQGSWTSIDFPEVTITAIR